MKITNKQLLPRLLVHAVTHDRYEPGHGDISVTTLISPAQQRVLRIEHETELEEDASMRVWSMLGSAVHYVIENAEASMRAAGEWDEKNIIEERFYWPMPPIDDGPGKTLSAQIDLFEEGELNDFKLTSVWTIKDAIENGKFEWDAQLNIQRYLMEKNGIAVQKIWIIAIARDWNKSGAMRDPMGYPPRVAKIEIPIWPPAKTEEYIMSRMVAHFGKNTPQCTPKECWEKPTKYALMKKGRQSAVRLLDSEAALLEYAVTKNLAEKQLQIDDSTEIQLIKDHYIDVRPGERTRCKEYCDVADFCEQYQDWRKEEAK
jgi:hypothetical protein